MSDTDRDLHPFSLSVAPIPGKAGMWQWAIRKHGKLLQRSDRPHPSEAQAAKDALAVIEKLLKGDDRSF